MAFCALGSMARCGSRTAGDLSQGPGFAWRETRQHLGSFRRVELVADAGLRRLWLVAVFLSRLASLVHGIETNHVPLSP